MTVKDIAKNTADFMYWSDMAPDWWHFADTYDEAIDQIAEWIEDPKYAQQTAEEITEKLDECRHDADYIALGISLKIAYAWLDVAQKVWEFWSDGSLSSNQDDTLDDYLSAMESDPGSLIDNISDALDEGEYDAGELKLGMECMDLLSVLL